MEFSIFFCLVILSVVNEGHSGCYEPPKFGRGYLYFFFDRNSETCLPFPSGGFEVGANNYETLEDCIRSCVCSLPSNPGPCQEFVSTYFFDIISKTCKEFMYGGCGGNKNNFETFEGCQQACLPYCNLPPETGFCEGYFTRYFYNTTAEACQSFIFGGCGANANNFLTLGDCEQACHH